MEDFNISQGDLGAQFLSYNYNKDTLKCDVLFPDGTIATNGTLHSNVPKNGDVLLAITIHGVEFQDQVGFGMSRFKDLKYKILEKKPEKPTWTYNPLEVFKRVFLKNLVGCNYEIFHIF